ncbi:DNA topoisomerase 6 subunit B [Dionaea muscipula]
MENGGSSESPSEPKKGKAKAPRKPKESSLKQKSPAEFFAENKNIAGFDNPGKCLYTTVRELVENSLDSAESISELPVVEVTIEEIGKSKFNSMIGLIDRERVDQELYDDYEPQKAREVCSPAITFTSPPHEYCYMLAILCALRSKTVQYRIPGLI